MGRDRGPNKTHGIQQYVEEVVPAYTLEDFKVLFHMSRSNFEVILFNFLYLPYTYLLLSFFFQLLLLRIAPHYPKSARIVPEKRLMLTLWMFCHPDTFKAVGDRFGLADSSAHFVFKETIIILKNEMFNEVRWPNRTEQGIIAEVSCAFL